MRWGLPIGYGHLMTTYFRAQTADRDVMELLDPAHVSYSWDSDDVYDLGTSTCASLEDLAVYLARTGIAIGLGDWVIVEVAGIDLGSARDAHMGEHLIAVNEIVSVRPLDDDFYALVGDAYDALEDR